MKKNVSFETFKNDLIKYLKNKNVVVNAGHFIPNSDNYDDIGHNPKITWDLGCNLVNHLKEKKINTKISLILNDIDLTIESRKIILNNYLRLPKPYVEILHRYNLTENDVLRCGWNKNIVYSEKQLSNRLEHLIRRKKIDEKYLQANDYCLSALLMYYLDLVEQNIEVAIFIVPKCTWVSIKKSIELFRKLNSSNLNFIAYFETVNCYL